MTDSRSEQRLTRLLRDHDPLASDTGLDREERIEMRRRILAEVPPHRGWTGRPAAWSPALTVVALLLVALGAALWPRVVDSPYRASPAAMTAPAANPPASLLDPTGSGRSLDRRKIQFETAGGTAVVWVLDPNFPS